MNGSNPWKLTAAAVALVLVTSLAIAVLSWTTSEVEWSLTAFPVESMRLASLGMAVVAPQASAMATPPPYAIAGCHRQASRPASPDARTPALKAGVLGSGTLHGLDQEQKRDVRYREAYARCMRSRGYSS